jgi:serine/threonine protein kinase
MAASPGQRGSRPQQQVPVGQYMLGDKLGRGAFGDVFKGLDTETGKFVAVKQVGIKKLPGGTRASDLPDDVMREVLLLKRLEHEHIVRYLNTVVTETHLNLVLEFIESGSLAQVLDRFGVFPEKLAMNYVKQVCFVC